MDDFYNAPACPLWLAFTLTVLIMAGSVYLIRQIRLLTYSHDRSAFIGVKALGAGMCAVGLVWMPIWFLYGMLALKFT
jgi:hypothetical protein